MRMVKMKPESMTLEQIIRKFLLVKESQHTGSETMKDYRNCLSRFLAHSHNQLDYITLEDDVLTFFAAIPDTSPARYNKPFQNVNAFMNWAADYAVVMTPGHCADLAVVRQVLAWGPSYVGCMGSRKKWAFLRTALAEAGFAPEQIDTVHLPIGLEIGARTPAELIAHRAALRGGGSGLCPA